MPTVRCRACLVHPSIFLPQRPRRELHQRRHLATGSGKIPKEFLTAHFLLAERNRCNKILHLQITDEAMVGIESARRSRQTAAFQLQFLADRRPSLGLPHDGRSYSGQGGIVWVPDSCCREAIFGFEVKVKHRRVGILAVGVMKMNSHVRLEGTLVGGEPDVTVNAKQRPTCRSGVSEKERAQFVEVRGETVDEQQSGFDDQLVVPCLVLGEPCPIVVTFQLTQELEQFCAEDGGIRHWGLPCGLVNSSATNPAIATPSRQAPQVDPSLRDRSH